MSVENFFPAHYPWQRVLANIAAGGGGEMNIGSPVACMFENYSEPQIGGYSSCTCTFNGLKYGDTVICHSSWGFSGNSVADTFASGLTMVQETYQGSAFTYKFYDAQIDNETGEYTALTEIEMDYDMHEDGEYAIFEFVIPELDEGHIFVYYQDQGE